MNEWFFWSNILIIVAFVYLVCYMVHKHEQTILLIRCAAKSALDRQDWKMIDDLVDAIDRELK